MSMEKESPKRMKSHLCIPRLRGIGNSSNCTIKSSRLSPMNLLERFREAVFRLMMLSALSKATTHGDGGSSSTQVIKRSYYNPADPHHSEAVADCIEFIKKSALTDDSSSGRDSTVSTSSSSSIDTTSEIVMSVPVM